MEYKTRPRKKPLSGPNLKNFVANDDEDLADYKGEYFHDQETKYQDPVTGAHFKYEDICLRLRLIQEEEQHEPISDNSLELDDVSFNPSVNIPKEQQIPELAAQAERFNKFLYRTQELVAQPAPVIKNFAPNAINQHINSQLQELKLNAFISSTLPDKMKHNRQGSCPGNYGDNRGVPKQPNGNSANYSAKKATGKGYNLVYGPNPKVKQSGKTEIKITTKKGTGKVDPLFEAVTLFSSM